MISYVISLNTAVSRREHICTEFGKKNIQFKFFDALTPHEAEPLAKELGLNYNSDRLTKGELACFMSHVSLWKKMIDENIPYMVIFEDDIFLGADSAQLLSSSDWIQEDWNIIKIEAFARKIIVGNSYVIKGVNRNIVTLKCKNLGTAGYILSNKGAQEYLNFVQSNLLIPLDEMMFDLYLNQKKLNIYQMSPALCIQEMMLFPSNEKVLPSDLLDERKERMRKFKKKGFAKFKLEVIRIFKQLQFVLVGTNNIFR